ncbi:MAG: hypothetical protein GXO23_04000 [Crenarchaeota archaeon]|nr:hypothetical protein [Thermoproteota archaeon]
MSLESSNYVVLQVRVPRWVKDMLDRYGIDPETVLRKVLEVEARRLMLREVEREVRKAREKLSRLSEEEIVSIIRKYRECR